MTTEAEIPSLRRNGAGLYDHVEYKYLPNGRIDWRAMVDKKWLYVNKENFKKRNQEVPDSIEGVADKDLCIYLAGLKELLMLRGFKRVEYKPICASREYVATVCRIAYIGNIETEGETIVFEAMGDAHEGNCKDFTVNYLAAMAENKAFCRAVRSFLGINIVASEEIGRPETVRDESPAEPVETLPQIKALAVELKLPFATFLNSWNAKRKPEKQIEAESWETIPKKNQLDVLAALRKIKKNKG